MGLLAKKKAMEVALKGSKAPFYNRYANVVTTHQNDCPTDIDAKQGDSLRVIAKQNGTWAVVMKEGLVGLSPEEKIIISVFLIRILQAIFVYDKCLHSNTIYVLNLVTFY